MNWLTNNQLKIPRHNIYLMNMKDIDQNIFVNCWTPHKYCGSCQTNRFYCNSKGYKQITQLKN